MILSGGNFGGYQVVGTDAVLHNDLGEVVDVRPVTIDTHIDIEGWKYTLDGIFFGV